VVGAPHRLFVPLLFTPEMNDSRFRVASWARLLLSPKDPGVVLRGFAVGGRVDANDRDSRLAKLALRVISQHFSSSTAHSSFNSPSAMLLPSSLSIVIFSFPLISVPSSVVVVVPRLKTFVGRADVANDERKGDVRLLSGKRFVGGRVDAKDCDSRLAKLALRVISQHSSSSSAHSSSSSSALLLPLSISVPPSAVSEDPR